MITITSPTTREQFKAYYALRYKVLSEPLGHPKGTEKDDYEPISEHFMALNESGEIVGVVKLFEKAPGIGQISHLAVAPEHQRQSVGRTLMEHVEQREAEKGYKTLGAMCKVTATAYFEKLGYHIAELPSLHDLLGKSGTTHTVWVEKKIEV
jgi:N-acetylglutamate synthase-like GNAT family acetyltransferase